MVQNALTFVLEALVHIFVFAALTRFFMQLLRAPGRNPLAQFSIALTDFVVRPLRRFIAPFGGMDWASLFTAWLAEFALCIAIFLILGFPLLANPVSLGLVALYALVRLVRLSIYIFMVAIFAQVILSWVARYHPFADFVNAFANPLLRPLQRRMPLIGGVDISPVFVLIALQLVLMLPVTFMEVQAWQALKQLLLP
jgi:YggT family protein